MFDVIFKPDHTRFNRQSAMGKTNAVIQIVIRQNEAAQPITANIMFTGTRCDTASGL